MSVTEQPTQPKNKFSCFLFDCPLTVETHEKCGEGCDKPGLGSPRHDPYDNKCGDCAILLCPCAFIVDIITSPYRLFYPTKI